MNSNKKTLILRVLFLVPFLVTGCGGSNSEHSHQHEEEHAHSEEKKGMHGGKLFEDGTFQVELKIFESGVPPQYRIYAYQNGENISPENIKAEVTLTRLGARRETFKFQAVGEFLKSEEVVEEPHSFEGELVVSYKGERHIWNFESYEGRTEMDDDVAKASGLSSEKSTARNINSSLTLSGKIEYSEHRLAHIIPRFSGVVREGRKHIGDRVEKGEILAIIESNNSLQPFEVKSQIAGTVIEGHLVVGEYVAENEEVFIVADLKDVWADFQVPLSKASDIKAGQKIEIHSLDGLHNASSTIYYVAPHIDEQSQSQLVRAIIPNESSEFLPGTYLRAALVVANTEVKVAIKKKAIQTFRDWQVVFMKVGNIYEVQPVTLGVSDNEWVEVTSGLSADEEYVVDNAFLIKADILKSGATHDH